MLVKAYENKSLRENKRKRYQMEKKGNLFQIKENGSSF